jgi:hypothetical protein
MKKENEELILNLKSQYDFINNHIYVKDEDNLTLNVQVSKTFKINESLSI